MKMLKFCTGYDGDKNIDLIQLKQMNNKVRILNLDNNQIFYDENEFNQINLFKSDFARAENNYSSKKIRA